MKYLKIGAGLLISGVCIWWALQGINFEEVGRAIVGLNWWLLAVSYIPYFIIMGMKITRWQVLLHPDKLPFPPLFGALCISFFWNTILPARLGEIVRTSVVNLRFKLGFARVLSTVLLEKILDVATNIVFLLCLLPFLNIDGGVRTTAFILGGIIVLGVATALIMAAFRQQAEGIIRFFLKPLPQKFGSALFHFAEQVLDSLAVLLNLRLALNIVGQSLILWTVNIFTYWLVGLAMGVPLTFTLALWVMIATNLGMAVPSAPGYLGVFHAIIIAALTPFVADKNLLVGYAVIMHLSGFLPVVILGAFFTLREGLSLGKITKQKDTAGQAENRLEGSGVSEQPENRSQAAEVREQPSEVRS
jgi:glycosyltransferase 2 family protein